MTIYIHSATATAVAGSVTTSSLKIPGGILSQVLVRANTDTTVFRAKLLDENGLEIRHYGFETHELNDMACNLAVAGSMALSITNASANDTFTIRLVVREN